MAEERSQGEFNLLAVHQVLPWGVPFDPVSFDFGLIPPGAGVFLLETNGEPFIGKSAALRKRLMRLLGPPDMLPKPKKRSQSQTPEPGTAGTNEKKLRPRLNLRDTTLAIRYGSTGSVFETSLLLYEATRAVFPSRYRSMMRLRVPALLKLNLQNEYPRCYVTRRLARSRALWYGPFPSRAAAADFAAEFLDLFLVRRCRETIRPDPAHPGCIYGEMNMCLRPCQAKCSAEDYRKEADRLAAFLSSDGRSLLREVEAGRDLASEQLEFEEAARLHKRLEKVNHAIRQRPELARDLESLHGLVVQRAASDDRVELFPVWRGFLLPRLSFTFELIEGRPVSMDARLRELLSSVQFRAASARVRGDHLALLARWYYRGSRKGEFVPFDSYDKLPFRRIVNVINRVARQNEAQETAAEGQPGKTSDLPRTS